MSNKEEESLFDFRCWLNKEFAKGRLNNISEIEHIIDVYLLGKRKIEGDRK